MANQEQLDLIKAGVDVWNDWVTQQQVDLDYAEFRDLSGADLSDANLAGINLNNNEFGVLNLEGINLSGANLSQAHNLVLEFLGKEPI